MNEKRLDSVALKPDVCSLKPEFVGLSPDGPGAPGYEFLLARGLSPDDIAAAAARYRLCYDAASRCLIFPHEACGIVVGWTSRTIDPTTFKRYSSVPIDQAQRFVLYDADRVCQGGSTLFICEGPLDAICVWLAGRRIGAASTALFGAWASPIQLATLRGLRAAYDRVFVMLDADVLPRALGLAAEIGAGHASRQTGVVDLGQECDDPAAMGQDALRALIEYAATSDEQRISWPLVRARLRASLPAPHAGGFGRQALAAQAGSKPPTPGFDAGSCPPAGVEAKSLEPDPCP